MADRDTYRDEEIRRCDMCGKHIVETRLPLFYTGTVETGGLDGQGLRERVGLSVMFQGATALASMMAGSPAARKIDEVQFFVCQPCGLVTPLAEIMEAAATAAARRQEPAHG